VNERAPAARPLVGRGAGEDVLVLALGLSLLLARPFLLGGTSSVVPFFAIYGCTLALAVGAGISSEERRVPSACVVGLGLVAVALARRWIAPGIPLPVTAMVVVLSTLAAVSEEAFFRGFLYGRLARFGPAAAVAISAAAFAAIHVPVYGVAAVWVDFGAGLLLGWQRWASGGWAAPALTHVAANLLMVIP
jgi:membrane protease YdiL (CAAX protease family)